VTLVELEDLAWKFRTLVALRRRREELEELGRAGFSEEEGQERRDTFRVLAGRFPGALRELDTCGAEVLSRRLLAIEAELYRAKTSPNGAFDPPRWMSVVRDFHAHLREALAVKRWLAERIGKDGVITAEVVDELHAWHATRDSGSDRPLTLAELGRHHHPPGGRVLSLVWETLVATYGEPREALEAMVFQRPE
jgi:hypothetical protein